MRSIIPFIMFGMMIGCAAGAPSSQHARSVDPKTILNKTWQWESTITPVEKIEVPNPEW